MPRRLPDHGKWCSSWLFKSVCFVYLDNILISARLLLPLPTPWSPWSHIAVDFTTGLPPSDSNTIILTVVDQFSKNGSLHSSEEASLGKGDGRISAQSCFQSAWFTHGCGLGQRSAVCLLLLEGILRHFHRLFSIWMCLWLSAATVSVPRMGGWGSVGCCADFLNAARSGQGQCGFSGLRLVIRWELIVAVSEVPTIESDSGYGFPSGTFLLGLTVGSCLPNLWVHSLFLRWSIQWQSNWNLCCYLF